jgi:hypothetical protein
VTANRFEDAVRTTLADAVGVVPGHGPRYARVLAAKRRRTVMVTAATVAGVVAVVGVGLAAATRGGGDTVGPPATQDRPSVSAPAAVSVPFDLYTHCGVVSLQFRGRTYRAAHPLVGEGNSAPVGWGNPYQHGRLTILGPTRVRFAAPGLPDVEFVVTPEQPELCS